MVERVGYRVVGTVKNIKGECSFGHKVGDKFELSAYDASGLCGFLYHVIYPFVTMLQFGGKYPDEWGGDVLEFDCTDKFNAVTIELRREK